MPSIINAATSGGLISTADTSGELQLQTASTTALTITSAQNVGIGTTSPTNYANQRTLAINGTTYGRIDLMAGGTVYGSLYGGTSGPTLSTGSALPVMFETAGTERMRINAGAPILCLIGGNTSATGTGIAFPATQSASSDANTLDDYEEGSWSPVLTDLTNNATMSVTLGRYIKIGRTVSLQAQVFTSSLGSVSGNIYISGLPFQAESTGANYAASGAGNGGNLAITANQSVTIMTDPGTSWLQLFLWDDAAGTTRMQASEWSSDGFIRFSITYFSQS
jgi:hypothetical protein